jgi:RNA polymerase sigma factor (TIGR02999 family)
MSEVTQLLHALDQGDPHAARRLLPLVYDELRQLARQWLAQERPGQTLDATALVHEAYIRLVTGGEEQSGNQSHWDGRRHFFAAAAEAMRRILIENARRKKRHKHGGSRHRVELAEHHLVDWNEPDELIALDEALTQLGAEDATAAEVVKLRVFAGLAVEEAAEVLGISRANAYRHWTYARAWLRCALKEET